MILFGVLVHFVLQAANLSTPAETTVQGFTLRRLWASIAAFIGLAAVGLGGLSFARPNVQLLSARRRAVLALVAGLVAAGNGAWNLAVANGGPGSGNGVVGAAAALVLGVIASALGTTSLVRDRHISFESERSA